MKKTILLSFLCLSIFGSFAQRNPKAMAFYRSALAYKNKNMLPEAQVAFKKALALDKTLDSAHVELGFICLRFIKNDSAVYHYKKAIAINPKNTMAWFSLGLLYRDTKPNYDSAIYCSKRILDDDSALNIRNDSLHKLCLYTIAWCYNSKKEYPKALQYSSKLLDFDNSHRLGYNEMANGIKIGKQYEEGIVLLKKYLAVAELEQPLYYLGLIYTELKNKDDAQLVYEKLLKVNPKMAEGLKKRIDKL